MRCDMNVSVIIPTYNRADLLPYTLKAILEQIKAPHEIIVVDDGSIDNTREVVTSYDPSVKYIWIENSGDLVARNVGLRVATGNFVAFCDSDDVWRREFTEE